MGTPVILPERDRMPLPPIGGRKAETSDPSYMGPPAMTPLELYTVIGQRNGTVTLDVLAANDADAARERIEAIRNLDDGWVWEWRATVGGRIPPPLDLDPRVLSYRDHRGIQ